MIAFTDRSIARQNCETRLFDAGSTFQETFLLLLQIQEFIDAGPARVTDRTVHSVASILESDRFEGEKQSFFVYQRACNAMIQMLKTAKPELKTGILTFLQQLLKASRGRKHRAVAEALGQLPLNIQPPCMPPFLSHAVLDIEFDELAALLEIDPPGSMTWNGRSLAGRTKNGLLGIIKFLPEEIPVENLIQETAWMDFLRAFPPETPAGFSMPLPFKHKDCALFCIQGLLPDADRQRPARVQNIAIAFKAAPRYYHYLNEPEHGLDPDTLVTCFRHNAALLGQLASQGIIHNAVIPLFHNRVQSRRRNDQGYYLWEHGGRLDQWLESCRYPNFGASGLRDFEHLVPLDNQKKLHHYIGAHLLSLILVAGSYFRNKSPDLKGFDSKGAPIDTRHLFDPDLFHSLVTASVQAYYEAVTQIPLKDVKMLLPLSLINQMIDKMGVDSDMAEHLRCADQQQMDENSFRRFILDREGPSGPSRSCRKGEKDIVFFSGPHLGGFNQPISVPGLIDLMFTLAALCISDRYALENGLKQRCI